jgi:hypothetical protein
MDKFLQDLAQDQHDAVDPRGRQLGARPAAARGGQAGTDIQDQGARDRADRQQPEAWQQMLIEDAADRRDVGFAPPDLELAEPLLRKATTAVRSAAWTQKPQRTATR